MRVLVCGGRDFGKVPLGCPPEAIKEAVKRALKEWQLLRYTLDCLKVDRGITAIIHGAARGADERAGLWARQQLIKEEPYEANWYPNGRKGGLDRSAGPKRNALMITEGRPDLVVAFEGGRGTADMVRRAKAAGIEVIEVPPTGGRA